MHNWQESCTHLRLCLELAGTRLLFAADPRPCPPTCNVHAATQSPHVSARVREARELPFPLAPGYGANAATNRRTSLSVPACLQAWALSTTLLRVRRSTATSGRPVLTCRNMSMSEAAARAQSTCDQFSRYCLLDVCFPCAGCWLTLSVAASHINTWPRCTMISGVVSCKRSEGGA